MGEWQPIETAPKDGTHVLLWFPELRQPVQVGHFSSTKHIENGRVTYESAKWWTGIVLLTKELVPSHWQPTPAAPTPANNEKD